MNISSSNVDIRTDHFHGASAVRFTVKGYLSHYSCGIAAKAWKDCAAENHQKHLLILDLTKMIANESSSRKTMVSTIQLTKRKIQAVVLISDSLLHRLYARFLLRSVEVPVIIYKSRNELEATQVKAIIA